MNEKQSLEERIEELEDRLQEVEDEFESIKRRNDEQQMMENFGF